MRFRRKPAPPPLPMSRFDHLVAGIQITNAVEDDIERLILDLQNALHCFEASSGVIASTRHRAEQLLMRLRAIQAP